MKVTLKTVQGTQFGLDVEDSTKVSDLKAMVQANQGDAFPAGKMLLIYQGKVLADESSLGDNKVSENGFMVVMITKEKKEVEKPAPAPAATPPPAAADKTAKAAPAAPAPADAPVPAAEPAAASTEPGNVDYSSAASTLASGSELEASIVEMGFPVEQVRRAMRAAFNNPDRAVEFLMTGIPESAEPEVPPAPGAGAAAGVDAGVDAAAGGGPNAQPLDMFPQGMPGVAGGGVGGGGNGSLDFLRDNPQFQALRQMVQANPQILQPMLQELGKQNPQLLQLINSNQQEFLRLINEPMAEGAPGMEALAAMGGGGEGEGGGATIAISEEDNEAIARLEAMGFDRALCIQAYLACDKNEEYAANFLLENPDMMADD